MKSCVCLAALLALISFAVHAGENPDQFSIDQLDALLADTTSPEEIVTVGDMRFRAAVLAAFRDQLAGAQKGPRLAAATAASIHLWTNGIVYYSFHSSVTTAHRKAFLDAAADWATFANLTFVLRTSQSDYILVKEDPSLSGGISAVGRIGGAQDLSIGSSSFNRQTLCHEIGHALGLVHEHQRSDRDTYVTINTANYPSGAASNFTKLPSSNNLITTYDFLSLMHYARDAFASSPGLDTITPKTAYIGFIDLMGRQRDRVLSKLDRTGMATLYGAGPALTPVVTKTADAGPGTLRAAIYQAIDTPGMKITFNIPTSDPGYNAGTGVFSIVPTGFMTRPGGNTTIDATTQPDTNPNGPEILLSGTTLRADTFLPTSGINLTDANCTVKGFIIQDFEYYGVTIRGTGATGNRISGCYIGTNVSGTGAFKNDFGGIDISQGANGNLIGGTATADRNVISGNGGYGVVLRESGTNTNTVSGNYIGTNAVGTGAVPNAFAGVGILSGAKSNVIGGPSAGARNVISGNTGQGILIIDPGTSQNSVLGNFIGVTAPGTAALPNSPVNHYGGVDIFAQATANIIGPGNVISGNSGGSAVTISQTGTNGNVIRGNIVGLNATASAPLPNQDGIAIFSNAAANVIGGSGIGHANIISGNTTRAIGIYDYNTPAASQTIQNTITGNSISGNGSGILLYQNANNSQPTPILTSAVLTTVTTVVGTLSGPNGTTHRVEFFSSSDGQGAVFIGAQNVTTNGGATSFTAPLAATIARGRLITATATAPNGNTSQFSASRTVTATDGDNDGLPFAYENATPGLSDSVAGDAASDLDGDGFSALDEFIAGTNPNDPTSRPISSGALIGSDFTVTFNTVAGKTYRVEKSANPGAPWSPIAVNILGTGSPMQATDTSAVAAARMFYRVVVER